MKTLRQALAWAQEKQVAIGHFNITDAVTLRAIFEVAKELSLAQDEKIPVLIGVSEGERDFLGVHEAVVMVRELAKEYDYPLFINADHTHSVERAKEAVDAGFDAVLFDGGKLPFDENVRQTKEVVVYARAKNPSILIEGELGYIGSGSVVRKELPKGAALTENDITKAEEAARFIKETGVDMLAPAVGNIHGMFKDTPDPRLFIDRIIEIKKATGSYLVLHGGSGNIDEDFVAAIKAGVNVIHISTEIRRAWREGVEEGLKTQPDEVSPAKLLAPALKDMKIVIEKRLRLFNAI
jgi:ketose-bisphosphate aldolase